MVGCNEGGVDGSIWSFYPIVGVQFQKWEVHEVIPKEKSERMD